MGFRRAFSAVSREAHDFAPWPRPANHRCSTKEGETTMTKKKESFEAYRNTLVRERFEGRPQFPLGAVVATEGVIEKVHPLDQAQALYRHSRGDWGGVCSEDWASNELSLQEGSRLLSLYYDCCGVKFWIITEADRSVTTLLLPDEY
jgi:hypothetical protein